MAVSEAVANAIASAIVRAAFTAGNRFPQVGDRHALLIDAHLAGRALRAVRRQTRIHLVQAKIDHGRATRYYLAAVVDERVAQYRHGLHAELQAFVKVFAVQHSAENIPVRTQTTNTLNYICENIDYYY